LIHYYYPSYTVKKIHLKKKSKKKKNASAWSEHWCCGRSSALLKLQRSSCDGSLQAWPVTVKHTSGTAARTPTLSDSLSSSVSPGAPRAARLALQLVNLTGFANCHGLDFELNHGDGFCRQPVDRVAPATQTHALNAELWLTAPSSASRWRSSSAPASLDPRLTLFVNVSELRVSSILFPRFVRDVGSQQQETVNPREEPWASLAELAARLNSTTSNSTGCANGG